MITWPWLSVAGVLHLMDVVTLKLFSGKLIWKQ